MLSFSRRQLRKFARSKWLLLFLTMLMVLFIGWREPETTSSVTSIIYEEAPSTAKEDHPELEYIRNNHLVKYDPSTPTNYSGRHKGWQQRMSKTVAGRLDFKRDGFFVECGALDGVYLSNSLLLEQDYGWTGLLIEVDPVSVKTLKRRNRQAWVADVCLSPKPHPMKVEMAGHNTMPEISYIKNPIMDKTHRFNKAFNRTIQVQCYPLAMLMDAINRNEIDYFSLDVEGMELDVLKTIPFDRIHIKLISVEVRPKQDEEIRKFLEPLGYKRIKKLRIPSDYMHDDLYEFKG